MTALVKRLRNKPFWIWDEVEHEKQRKLTNGNCCFNDIIPAGRPSKNGIRMPLWDYQKLVYDTLLDESDSVRDFQKKHCCWLKPRGCGGSELILRIMAWLSLRNEKFSNSQMCICTGSRLELSISLINRMKELFATSDNNITFDSKETVVELPHGITITAYPSHRINSMRGQPNVSFIFADEVGAWLQTGQEIASVRGAIEGYIQKSNPFLCLMGTANMPGDLLDRIFNSEKEDECIYRRVKMDWSNCVNKIYSEQDIARARMSQTWDREMCGNFGFGTGNLFRSADIDACIIDNDMELSQSDINTTVINFGLDPGSFGSRGSKFGIVISCVIGNQIFILETIELSQTTLEESVSVVVNLLHKYGYYQGTNSIKVFCDKAFPAYITALKERIRDGDYNWQQEFCKQQKIQLASIAVVSGVSFAGEEGRGILFNIQSLVSSGDLKILRKCSSLLLQMRIARTLQSGHLDKSGPNSMDLVDAAMLSLSNIGQKI